jgi:putative FmdB family regulatory protein
VAWHEFDGNRPRSTLAAQCDNERMPTYAYRCRECEDQFELSRPMSESSAPTPCPVGHDDTVKLLTTISLGGRAGAGAPVGGGGGCCGGACGCG